MHTINKGFSLIELLVVITVASLMIAISTVSYTTAQRSARDSRRIRDMREVQTAFEQYYAVNQAYPNETEGNIDTAFNASRPVDPKSGSYLFENTSATAYCICALLENATGNAQAPTSTACTWNDTENYYCIQNQQ